MLRCNPAIAFVLSILTSAGAMATAQRTFVASYGSPANTAFNCSIAEPCRAFGEAISVTNGGGEVIVLDSAGYGVVSINQSVSIVAPPGVYAGISVLGSSNGIYINSGEVTLRGLTINGQSASSISGVFVFDGGTINIESYEISDMGSWGVEIAPLTGKPTVNISNSIIRHSLKGGIAVTQGDSTRLSVMNTAVSGGQYGVWVAAGFALARDTVASQNVADGFALKRSPTQRGVLACERCTSVGNGGGFKVDGTGSCALMTISQSLASENGQSGIEAIAGTIVVTGSTSTLNGLCGLSTSATGIINSAGNNLVQENLSGEACGNYFDVGTF